MPQFDHKKNKNEEEDENSICIFLLIFIAICVFAIFCVESVSKDAGFQMHSSNTIKCQTPDTVPVSYQNSSIGDLPQFLERFFMDEEFITNGVYEMIGWCIPKDEQLCFETTKIDQHYSIYIESSQTNLVKRHVKDGRIHKGQIFQILKLFDRLELIFPYFYDPIHVSKFCKDSECFPGRINPTFLSPV